MDKLNQPNRPNQQGTISETSYNKPLQQPVRPVRPGQQAQQNQNRNYNQGSVVRPQMQQKPIQQGQAQQGQAQQGQQVNTQKQRVVQNKYNQQQYQNIQKQQVIQQHPQQNNQQRVVTQRAQEDDNSSLARGPKLTRLQREAQGLPSKPVVDNQYIGNKTLGQKAEYALGNNNENSFKVKRIKQEGVGFLLLPLSLVVLLGVIILILLGDVILSVNELDINTTSLLNSKPASRDEFVSAAERCSLQIDTKELGGGISEVMAYTDDYSYEINYITFESSEETQAYYNYIIDTADESESSVSSSIVGQNSAESTLISNTYNGFMDITYIDNTIIIAIAYDSNKQTEVIEFMNDLGY